MLVSDSARMRAAHCCYVKVMRNAHDAAAYHSNMNLTEAGSTATRTLTIVLPESEWLALRTAEPDAIGWLQAQIRQRLGDQAKRINPSTGSSSESWADDEY
jgi:hypothetical protein